MHRFVALFLAVALSASGVLADPVADSVDRLRAVAGRDLSVLFREGQPAIRHLSGRLTAAPAADVRQAGAEFLAAHARALGLMPGTELRSETVLPLNTGTVLRYRQYANGLPVVRGDVVLRFHRDGLLGVVNSGLTPFDSLPDSTPGIGSAQALALAAAQPQVVSPLDGTEPWMGLVYYPVGDQVKLAWQIELGRLPALLANWVVWIDAQDGSLLEARNRIWFDRLANTFEENPVSTPDMIQVTLGDLPAWTADPYYLTGELMLARNCIDRHVLTRVTAMGMTLDVHMCTEEQVAAGDASHDFLYDDNADTAPEDLFAEAQMFYHTTKVYDFFQGLGFDHLEEVPLRATVNFRIPIDMAAGFDMANLTNPDGILYPFDNAMFMPAGDSSGFIERDADSIVFGQGTRADFAYDGDIVYHEFAHAVVGSTSNLAAATVDSMGLDNGPGSLNEGYADIFAMFLTADPLMGEYGGQGLTTSGVIRSLEANNVCPEDLMGEVHEDSLPWSIPAWDLFQEYGEELVQPYFDAMVSLNQEADFALAVRDTLHEIETQIGTDAAAAAQAAYEARNIVDCERWAELGRGRTHTVLMGEGTGTVGLSPYVPGYLGFKIDVPSGQHQVVVHFLATGGGFGGGTPVPHVLFKRDVPISFSYLGSTVDDNADYQIHAASVGTNEFQAVYCENDGLIEPGEYYVHIANAGSGGITMQGITISANDGVMIGPCIDGPGEDGGDGGADVVADAGDTAAEVPTDGGSDAPAVCDPTACESACIAAGQAGGECAAEGYCACTSGGGDGCDCRAAGGRSGTAWTVLGLLGAVLGFVLLRRRTPRA